MKVIGINGSPRGDGNTQQLLTTVLAPMLQAGWEGEILQIGGKDLHGCRACGACLAKQDHTCGQGTDIFNGVFEKVLAADAVILGSPTYFTDVTTEMKAFIDRAGFVAGANGSSLAGKIGAEVVAVRRGGATHAFDTMNHLFLISQMIVPGSTYWNMGYGLEPGAVSGDGEALRNMRHLGKAIDWLGKTLQKAGSPYPVRSGEDV
jgi:multimeric flavodoxin WrbA